LKKGDKIENAILTEITQADIKYNVEGRAVVYTISKDDVAKITYNDGSEDIFSVVEQSAVIDLSGMLEDYRDGKTYKVVKMPDGKTWMAQNLNYETGESECYEKNNDYCDYCGRLYDWKTATEACPAGWHLPTDAEWSNLKTVSGGHTAGKTLKSKNNWSKSIWGNDGNGNDDYGFSVLACGLRPQYIFFPTYSRYGSQSYFWSASNNIVGSWARQLHSGSDDMANIYPPQSSLFSIRCVKDDTLKTPKPLMEQFGGIGYQQIWDMHHIRMVIEWFYFTEGFKIDDYVYNKSFRYNLPGYVPGYDIEYTEEIKGQSFEMEIIMGYIHRWTIAQPDNFIRTSFGLFGGLGARLSGYSNICDTDNSRECDKKFYINARHELGAELVLGYVSLYIAERNFYRIGGGIGLAFWRTL
jgi:uncharacterized protein (TIGR02145 family)